MSDLSVLKRQLARMLELKKVARQCRINPNFDPTIVSQTANGQLYECLYGAYARNNPDLPPFGFDVAAEYFGCTNEDAQIMFGSLAALVHREMMIEACVAELRERIEIASKLMVAA